MVVRSQAEQRTRIPERLLQALIERTYDFSVDARISPGVAERDSHSYEAFPHRPRSAMLVG
jgi:hypothetical protein